MESPQLPPDVEGLCLRMRVRSFLDDNIAFVHPIAYSLGRAKLDWKTRQLRISSEAVESMAVKDDKSLCHAFYTRGFKRNGQPGNIARILPHKFKALVVMHNGYFYELFGADRLVKHIGKAGTNGMILDRDIEIAIGHRQLLDRDEVQAMLDDPQGYEPLM